MMCRRSGWKFDMILHVCEAAVQLDFLPMLMTDVQNSGKTTQALIPEADVAPENAPQP